MKKTLTNFFLASLGILSLWLLSGKGLPELRAFACGLLIFSANLIIWVLIVREMTRSAAEAAMSLTAEGHVEVEPNSENPSSDSQTEKPGGSKNPSRAVGFLIGGMTLKILLLGGGIYICLVVLRFEPAYFIGGLAAGLGLFALSAYVSKG